MRRVTCTSERWTYNYQAAADDDQKTLSCVATVSGLRPVVQSVQLDIDCTFHSVSPCVSVSVCVCVCVCVCVLSSVSICLISHVHCTHSAKSTKVICSKRVQFAFKWSHIHTELTECCSVNTKTLCSKPIATKIYIVAGTHAQHFIQVNQDFDANRPTSDT